MALLDLLDDLRRKTARRFRPRQHGLIFAQQMLIELRLQRLPASLRLRAHRAIRRPKPKNNPRHRRVEQWNPKAIFLPTQLLSKIPNLPRIRPLPAPTSRRLLSDFHIRFHNPHRPPASTVNRAPRLSVGNSQVPNTVMPTAFAALMRSLSNVASGSLRRIASSK